MILQSNISRRTSWPVRIGLILLGCLTLSLSTHIIQADSQKSEPAKESVVAPNTSIKTDSNAKELLLPEVLQSKYALQTENAADLKAIIETDAIRAKEQAAIAERRARARKREASTLAAQESERKLMERISQLERIIDRLLEMQSPGDSDVAADAEIAGVWSRDTKTRYGSDVGAKAIALKYHRNGYHHFVVFNPETGVIDRAHGGRYTVDGNRYTEYLEYATYDIKYYVDFINEFEFDIVGDRMEWRSVNVGYREVWRRESDDKMPSIADLRQMSSSGKKRGLHSARGEEPFTGDPILRARRTRSKATDR